LWYGRTWSSVRKRIRFVLAAAVAKNANGFAEMPNWSKNQCSMIE
jgi:uncharacterized membrane protein YhdT